jgi:putative ABC transport system substrate-binding protein
MRRRHLLAFLGIAAVMRPCFTIANNIRTVGVLMQGAETQSVNARLFDALRQSLAQLGWREGVNLKLEVRWANNEGTRAKAAAQELVGINPDVIVAPATSIGPVREATRSIPIVFLLAIDPVGQGIVSSLAHPGGNLTGFAYSESSIGGKLVELLREIAPGTARVLALLGDPATRSLLWPSIEGPARDLGLDPQLAQPRTEDEIDAAIHAFAKIPNGGIVVPGQSFLVAHRARVIAAAAKERLPAVYGATPFATDGGLLSYSDDALDEFSRAASYVDQILKGAKPGDLPVQQPTKFELVINLKTAKALGLTIPLTILARADEVIE